MKRNSVFRFSSPRNIGLPGSHSYECSAHGSCPIIEINCGTIITSPDNRHVAISGSRVKDSCEIDHIKILRNAIPYCRTFNPATKMRSRNFPLAFSIHMKSIGPPVPCRVSAETSSNSNTLRSKGRFRRLADALPEATGAALRGDVKIG